MQTFSYPHYTLDNTRPFILCSAIKMLHKNRRFQALFSTFCIVFLLLYQHLTTYRVSQHTCNIEKQYTLKRPFISYFAKICIFLIFGIQKIFMAKTVFTCYKIIIVTEKKFRSIYTSCLSYNYKSVSVFIAICCGTYNKKISISHKISVVIFDSWDDVNVPLHVNL